MSLDAARGELAGLLGERFSTSPSVLGLHARDESRFAPREPDAVAFPASTEEVAGVVRVAARHRVPLIPWGAGSSPAWTGSSRSTLPTSTAGFKPA